MNLNSNSNSNLNSDKKFGTHFCFNPDKERVNKIIAALKANDGYCPCVLVKSSDTKCPCKQFRETMFCHCGLYVSMEAPK